MTEELKPCPFCGADAVLTEHEPHDHSPGLVALTGIPAKHPGSWTVECVACSCGMIHRTREEVEAAWNRRSVSASIADTAGAKPIGYASRKHLERIDERHPALIYPTAEDEWTVPVFAAPPAPSVADAAGASERIKALFIENPPDEMGPSDEPESQYRLGYNTALEDAIDAIAKEAKHG